MFSSLGIKRTLFLLTGVLVVLTAALAGRSFLDTWRTHRLASAALKINGVVGLLLESADHWAAERGATYAALNRAAATPETRRAILDQRAEGDERLRRALSQLEGREFPGSDALIQKVRSLDDRAKALRAQVDRDLGDPKIARNAEVARDWLPVLTALIGASQDLRLALEKGLSEADPSLGQLQHFLWIMTEYARLEHAIVGGIVSATWRCPTTITPCCPATADAWRRPGKPCKGWPKATAPRRWTPPPSKTLAPTSSERSSERGKRCTPPASTATTIPFRRRSGPRFRPRPSTASSPSRTRRSNRPPNVSTGCPQAPFEALWSTPAF